MKKLSTLLFFSAIALVGCKNADPVQTVDWYKTHDTERKEMIVKCNSNPGELAASPYCINAITAANRLTLEKRDYTKHEPINLFE